MSQHLDPTEVRKQIQAVLTPVGLYSENAEQLLIATCAQESLMGTYRTQVNGPAKGILQCEANTFNDLVNNFLIYHPTLLAWAKSLTSDFRADGLVNNDPFALAIGRLHYYRVKAPIPDKNDFEGMWNYYKTYYNSVNGAATKNQFKAHWELFIGPLPA